jgi:hypothetical protein
VCTGCGSKQAGRLALGAAVLIITGSCRQYVPLTEQGTAQDSFGQVMYEAVCERVGYSHELDVRAQDPAARIDVSGAKYHAACTTVPPPGALPPTTDAPKVNVLIDRRSDVVAALDLILPDALLDPVNAFLQAILPLYDDGTFTKANAAIGALLRVFAGDDELTGALARLGGRDGYRPLEAALGLTRQVFDDPDIDTVLKSLLRTLDDGGVAHDAFLALTAALHLELVTAQPVAAPRDPERTMNLALPVLFAQDANGRFGSGVPRLLVRRDFRGIAGLAGSGTVPAPFVDHDGDGLPDVDSAGRFIDANGNALSGYWPFPTKDGPGSGPRDAKGRLLANGQPVYDYLDLDNTLLAGAVRDSAKLFDADKDTVLKLVRGASALLGPRETVAKPYTLPDGSTSALTFQGFDTRQAALLEMIYALLQVMGAPNIDATLDGTQALLRDHEDIAAWFTATALGIKEFAKRPEFASAVLPESSTIFDDLIPVLRRLLANEALVADLMDALKDPITQNLGRIHSYYMTYRDRWDPDQNNINGPPIGGFTEQVDRNAPDTGFNQSINQRLFHLVHDTNGAVLCSKAGATVEVYGIGVATYDNECDLFKVDNLGKFYVQSIARVWDPDVNRYVPKAVFPMNLKWPLTWAPRSLMDSTLESESGITGFQTHPTTEALNRVIFVQPTPQFLQNLENDPVGVDGEKLVDAHAGTIMAWEVKARDLNFSPFTNATYDPDESLFYQSLRPVVQAFADHDEEGLFLDLVSVLYHHWSTTQATAECQFTNPTDPRYCFGDGAVRYEPLIAAIFDPQNATRYPSVPPATFDLMRVLTASAPVLADLTLSDGRPARPEIVSTVSWLVTPQPGLTYRDGTGVVNYQRLVPENGQDTYDQGSENVSAFELLADSFAAKRQALAAAGPVADDWKTASGDLVDLYLGTSSDGQRFTNPHLPATAAAVIPFLRGRLARHQQQGDLTSWLRHGLMQDVEDGLANPVFAGLVDLTLALQQDDEARRSLYGLASYLLDERHNQDAFQVALTVISDIVQLLVDDPDLTPILRAGGRALDPELGAVENGLSFLSRARALDQGGVLCQVLRNVWQRYGAGDTPIGTMIDVGAEVHRLDPGHGGPLTAEDYREVLRQSAEFVDDNARGLQRFIDVVQNRKIAR